MIDDDGRWKQTSACLSWKLAPSLSDKRVRKSPPRYSDELDMLCVNIHD
jgi:hypothetical protein